MAGYSRGMSGSGQLFGPGGTSFSATFDQALGSLLTTDDINNDLNGMQSIDVDYLAGNISWGEFIPNGGGTLGGNSTASAAAPMPYVVGSAVQTLPGGILNYSLAGATSVRDSAGGVAGTLDSFNLGIDVGSATYGFTSQLTIFSNVYSASSAPGSVLSVTQNGFSFATSNVSDSSSQCFSSCGLSVEGFLAGPNAEQAGISYMLSDFNSSPYTGAAGLTQ